MKPGYYKASHPENKGVSHYVWVKEDGKISEVKTNTVFPDHTVSVLHRPPREISSLNGYYLKEILPVEWTIGMVISELLVAEAQHPDWPDDRIYQAAIVNEEAGELIKAVLENRFEKNKNVSVDDIRAEAVQVGAMAIRFLCNLKGE